MSRRRKLGRNYIPSVARAHVTDEQKVALAATMRAIADAPELPAHPDAKVTIPPTRVGYVRRVRSYNLWLHFTFTDEEVLFTSLVTNPPLPIDESDE